MVKSKLKVPALLLSIAFMSMLLAACGSGNHSNTAAGNDASTPPASTAPAASPAQTKMTDGLGHEVEVPADPQRIIASYLEDYLVALGVKPVAQWSVANGTQEYLQDSLKDLPTIPYDLPLEAVTSFDPDLLIIGSNSAVEGGKYDQYAKIAPTFVLGDEVNNDWRKALLKIGEVLHKSDEAQKVLDDYEKKAADAKAKLEAAIPGKSVAAVWLVQGKFYVVSDKLSSGAVLYKDLGLKAPEVVKEISASGAGNWNAISLEKLADLDADYLILVNSDKDSGSAALNDALWKSVPAVKNGNVFEYPKSSSWLYYGPVASSQMVDNLLKDIVK
ncbi:ABC transporter substrate-binding protein [Paenibacillus sp. P22]|uniref:ABC transporter substrate-binding protein n=1 Tax=Paenibacillus sp. P22 TaxID=483908 RepID=UPI000406B0C7|nr:ABC transporter substrate-binding protein [Paenibacillus sp. P22]